tara:strand:+ start:5714 stop:6067 length:354 start_codon:yes stop_codon:yes gene_type:complete
LRLSLKVVSGRAQSLLEPQHKAFTRTEASAQPSGTRVFGQHLARELRPVTVDLQQRRSAPAALGLVPLQRVNCRFEADRCGETERRKAIGVALGIGAKVEEIVAVLRREEARGGGRR